MLPCNSSDSSDWLKICLYKYGTCPSIKSCMKQYLIFICDYHSMKCRNKQSCQVQPKSMSQSWEQAANSRFSFYRKLHKDIFDFLIYAWWYLWTNCPEVILTFIKFQTPHQEFTIQNLYALLWCKLHRSTSSQLGTKWYPSIATFVTCGRVAHKASRQIIGKWIATHHINNRGQLLPCFHFFVYGKLNFYANCAEVSK